jgi:hypothetical protein
MFKFINKILFKRLRVFFNRFLKKASHSTSAHESHRAMCAMCVHVLVTLRRKKHEHEIINEKVVT